MACRDDIRTPPALLAIPSQAKNHELHSIFPQEVYENIIDHLHEDRPTLRICGLVCRAWVPASRYHLFNEVLVILNSGYRSTVPRFIKRSKSVDAGISIAPYIRKISITDYTGGKRMDFIYLLLRTLRREPDRPGYQSINLAYIDLDFEKLRDVLPLWRITKVDFARCTFDSYKNLMALFGSMPNLQMLELGHLEPSSAGSGDDDDIIEERMLFPQLRTLIIRFDDGRPLLRHLAPPPMLRWDSKSITPNTCLL
jgi:hypothetical protein